MEQPLGVSAENSRAKVKNVGGDSSAINSELKLAISSLLSCCALRFCCQALQPGIYPLPMV